MVAAGALLAYAPLPAVVPLGDLLNGAALAQSNRGDGGNGGDRGGSEAGGAARDATGATA
ncbi:hypothetical protein [uncultured Paracoccus sp.]|uniref:hypothetical protein n=1 Tax=uncultured Paracoccus sp. TaxID=189685 RepID=UPI00261983AA|nr:hypothetical protein [uncultured Paracoccus sp.]